MRKFDLAKRREWATHSLLAHAAVADSRFRCLEQRIAHRATLTAASHRWFGLVHQFLLRTNAPVSGRKKLPSSPLISCGGKFLPIECCPMPISIDHIIERLGGAEAAARLTGVGTEAVRKWRQSRAIPSRHWSAVAEATGLTLADLQT